VVPHAGLAVHRDRAASTNGRLCGSQLLLDPGADHRVETVAVESLARLDGSSTHTDTSSSV
jgi:hypothetical protein